MTDVSSDESGGVKTIPDETEKCCMEIKDWAFWGSQFIHTT
jgi:hypothetical protein